MEQTKEANFSSAPIPFRNHTALLLGTALPYLQPVYRHPVELALKFLEFTETLRLFQEFHMRRGSSPFFSSGIPFSRDSQSTNSENASGFFGLIGNYITDLEGLLTSLTSVCTGDEKELIGMFLNLIRAKNFYDTYGELLKTQFSDSDGLSGLFSGFGDIGNLFSGLSGASMPQTSAQDTAAPPAPAAASALSAMLNEEQKETLDLLKSLFSED